MMEGTHRQLFAEDFAPGQTFSSSPRMLDEAAFRDFARLTGDAHPIHYDAIYAAKTQFGRPVAHGLLLTAMTALGAAEISRHLRESMVALVDQHARFIKPVFVGERVQCLFRVVSVVPKQSRKIAVVRFAVELMNGDGEPVLRGEHTYLLRSRPAEGGGPA